MNAINFHKALSTMLSGVRPLSVEDISLDHALGRVTAARVFADEDAVPFPPSAMDGFAVRASECALATQGHPIELPVAGQVFAEKGESTLAPRTTLAITTGASVPRGADAVIPHECAEQLGASVRIFAPARPGRPHFVLARVHCEAEGFVVEPLANQCSALVRTAADANAIVTVPETTGESGGGFLRNEMIEVQVFDWSSVFTSLCETHLAKEAAA